MEMKTKTKNIPKQFQSEDIKFVNFDRILKFHLKKLAESSL